MWNSCKSVFRTHYIELSGQGNDKNEIRQRDIRKGKRRGMSVERKAATKKEIPTTYPA